jgi:hypothetical protein
MILNVPVMVVGVDTVLQKLLLSYPEVYEVNKESYE